VQLGLPFTEDVLTHGESPAGGKQTGGLRIQAKGLSFHVHFVRMRRARRYILRVRPDGALRVTIPRGGSRAEALRFAERHLSWAERERARLLATRRPPVQWTAGTSILIDGEPVPIVREGERVTVGTIAIRVPVDVLNLRPAIESALRDEARRILPPQLLALAALNGLSVERVTIRNQRSRWGSCSRSARIALNFRLIQMPPDVREYILLHELMHIRHPNHSRRFWRAVEALCPSFRETERWLKRNGHDLF
jgi:predicted metal-dependent hydrolase